MERLCLTDVHWRADKSGPVMGRLFVCAFVVILTEDKAKREKSKGINSFSQKTGWSFEPQRS
jgi:hypothetical protein